MIVLNYIVNFKPPFHSILKFKQTSQKIIFNKLSIYLYERILSKSDIPHWSLVVTYIHSTSVPWQSFWIKKISWSYSLFFVRCRMFAVIQYNLGYTWNCPKIKLQATNAINMIESLIHLDYNQKKEEVSHSFIFLKVS